MQILKVNSKQIYSLLNLYLYTYLEWKKCLTFRNGKNFNFIWKSCYRICNKHIEKLKKKNGYGCYNEQQTIFNFTFFFNNLIEYYFTKNLNFKILNKTYL